MVTVDGAIEAVGPALFGETTQSEEYYWYAYATVDPESGNYHVALTAAGIESRLPLVRLYHGESGEIEELPFRYLGGPAFFPDGRLILQRTVSTLDASGRPISPFETWIRALDPPGGEPRLLVPIGYSWELGRWAPDWSRAAVPSVDGPRLVLVSIPGGAPLEVWQSDMPVFPVAWSPDGRHLAVVQRGSPQRPEDRLLLLPVEP